MFPGILADTPVLGDRFGVRVAAPVIQVHAAAAIAYLLGFDAHIHQAFAKLSILPAILHALVKAIGRDDMFLPGG